MPLLCLYAISLCFRSTVPEKWCTRWAHALTAVPPRAGWLCRSPSLTAATSPVFGSVLTPGWSSTLRRWLSPSPDPSSAPSRSRASWDLREPLKLELASVLPVLLGAHTFMVVPDGDGDTPLEPADHAKPSESCCGKKNVQEMTSGM